MDPVIDRWLARIAELAEAPSEDLTERRAAATRLADRLAAEFALPVHADVTITDEVVAGVPVRRYRPATPTSAAQVSFHGGGMWAGSVHELVNDSLLSHRSAEAGVEIVAVDYRLAPEHPYPGAIEDAVAVVEALDHPWIGIGGVSAGGWVAAIAALVLRDRGFPLRHQQLEVPAVALRIVDDGGPVTTDIAPEELDRLRAMVLGEHPSGSETVPLDYLEPLDVADLAGVAPAWIAVAEFDALRGGGVRYAERLTAAGVETTLYRGVGHLHATAGLTRDLGIARDWQRQATEALRTAIELEEDR